MNIVEILRSGNNRVTAERVAIFEFLETKHLFTYNDIVSAFPDIGRASIFRTLNLFMELGIIRKVEMGGNVATYEIQHDDHHHEHMKCSSCETVINFDSHNICNKIFKEAKKIGFEITSHSIGVLGKCKNCV